jgi:translation initiation factor IF-2
MKPGSHIISGTSHAKVRLMNDSSGLSVKTAYPGMAVTVSGWKTLPSAGDEVLEGSEADVKKAVVNRVRKADAESTLVDIQAINEQRRLERERKEESGDATRQTPVETPQEPKALRLVIKGDVSGSVEAVEGALQGIGNKQAFVKIVSTGVGDVTESDMMMAKAAEGTVYSYMQHHHLLILRFLESNSHDRRLFCYDTSFCGSYGRPEQRAHIFVQHYLPNNGSYQGTRSRFATVNHREESHGRSDRVTIV